MDAAVVREVPLRFDTLPSFAVQVARQASDIPPAEGRRLIDFGGVNLLTWTAGAEDFSLAALEDKVVFVGDMGDLRDWHNIPVGAGGQSRLAGLEIHALATAALLSEHPYRTLPHWLSLLLQWGLIFLFCWLLCLLPQTMDNWVHGALQIAFMLLMLPVCYLLFLAAHIVCSPTLAIVGFGLAELAKDIIDAIFKE